MSSLRRPPIEFLFCSSFICFSFCFRVCHSKTSFYWAGDPRSQEYRPRRRCEAGPAAPKPMAPGNGATFLWRHAVVRRFGAAVDNTRSSEVSSSHFSASLLWPLPFPLFARVRATPMVSLGCGHRRAAERSPGLYPTQRFEPSSRRSAPVYQPTRSWLGPRTLGLVSPPRALVSARERTRPSTFPLIVVGRSHPSLRPMRSLASGETPPLRPRAVDLYGRLCRRGPWP